MGKKVEYKQKWLALFNEKVSPLLEAFKIYSSEPDLSAKKAADEFVAFVNEARERINNSKVEIKKGTIVQAATQALRDEGPFIQAKIPDKNGADANITELLDKLDRDTDFTKEEVDNEVNPLNIKTTLSLFKLLILCLEQSTYTDALNALAKSPAGDSKIALLDTALRRRIHYVGMILNVHVWYRCETELIALQSKGTEGIAYDALVNRANEFSKNYSLVLFPQDDKNTKLTTVKQFLERFEKLFLKYQSKAIAQNAIRTTKVEAAPSSPEPITTTVVAPLPPVTADVVTTAPKNPTPPTSPRPEPKQESSRLWHFVGIGAASVIGIGVAVYAGSYIPALRPVTKPIMDIGNACKDFILNLCHKTFGRA